VGRSEEDDDEGVGGGRGPGEGMGRGRGGVEWEEKRSGIIDLCYVMNIGVR